MDGKIVYTNGKEEILKYGLTKIDDRAYSEDKHVSGVRVASAILPSSVTWIGDYAFWLCSNMKSVDIPYTVTTIGKFTFAGAGLTNIMLHNSVKRIDDYAFYCCHLKDVYYSGSADEWKKITIGKYNESLTKANIHYNYRFATSAPSNTDIQAEIAAKAAAEAKAKAEAEAKARAEAQAKAEAEAKALAEAKARAEAQLKIAAEARLKAEKEAKNAADARALADRKLKEQIEARIAAEKRAEAEERAKIEAEKRAEESVSLRLAAEKEAEVAKKERIEAEELLEQFIKELSKGKAGEMIEQLDSGNLETKNIPLALQALLNGKVIYTSGEEESIKHNITEIEPYEYARKDCLSVVLPGKVTTIGNDAFYHCNSLESITIPKSVTSIGEGAFGCCEKLKDIYYPGTPQEWDRISIGEENKKLIGGWGKATIHYNSK